MPTKQQQAARRRTAQLPRGFLQCRHAAGFLSGDSRMATASADMGLIGLAVMGENLVLNMESKGYTVAVHNRTVARVDAFLAARAKGKRIIGCHSVKELVAILK